MIKSFETGNNPVRCAKFIVRKQYIIAGTDDMRLRVFNYNTMDKVRESVCAQYTIVYSAIQGTQYAALFCT